MASRRGNRSFGYGDEIVTEVEAKHVAIAAGTFGIITILVCYGFAVYLGHVEPFLPMISDCAVQAPEKYIFRFGMILSAAVLELNSILMFFFLNSTIMGKRHGSDTLGMSIVSLACIGLGMVGSINEQEDNPVHSVFFIGYVIYMFMITARVYSASKKNPGATSSQSLIVKASLTAICFVALMIFFYLSTGSWSKGQPYIAICEWIGTFSIILYNLSFVYEYQSTLDLAAVVQPSRVRNNQAHELETPFIQ